MSGKRVIELRDVAIYHAENPFGRQSAERLVRSGELVLSEVDFSVEEGEFVYLIGRVGSGKSTLLKTLYADVQLLVGEGCVVGFDLRKLRRRQIPYLRRKIGIVFQDYQLLTDRNVFQNLYYVMRATGWRAEAEIRRRIDEVLQLVGLEAKHYKMPFELSGGEQQRLVYRSRFSLRHRSAGAVPEAMCTEVWIAAYHFTSISVMSNRRVWPCRKRSQAASA